MASPNKIRSMCWNKLKIDGVQDEHCIVIERLVSVDCQVVIYSHKWFELCPCSEHLLTQQPLS